MLSSRTRRAFAAVAPIGLIFLLWLLFFWRILTPVEADRLTFQQGDFTLQFLAYRQMAYRQFAQGRFPVFEECIYSGYPFQADPQSQGLYPPVPSLMWLGRALGWSEYPLRALEWEVMAHVLIAALTMYAFLRLSRHRTLGTAHGSRLHRIASLIGAVAFAFSGFMTGYAMLQTAILETAAWLPLILLALNKLATSKRWLPAAALLAVSVALAFTAGHPQTLLFVVYSGAAAFVFWSWRARSGIRPMILRGGTAAVFAVGLSAAQLIPSLSFTLASTRASLPFEEAGQGFVLHDLALFVLTGVFNVWQPLYVGIASLVLAGIAIVTARKVQRSDVWLWVIIGLSALVLSFGANAFGFDVAYLAAPGYHQFQSQERHAVIVTLVLSIFAAYGAHALLCPMRVRALVQLRRTARSLAVWGWIAFAAVVAVALANRLMQPSQPELGGISDRVAMIALGLLGTAALFAWRSRLGRTPRWLWGLALFALLVFDLLSVNRYTATQPLADPFPSLPLIEPIKPSQPSNSNSRIYNHYGLPLNGACVRGLNEIGGGSPIVLRDYKTFLERTPEDVFSKLLNVRHTVTWRGAVTTDEGREIPWFLLARATFEGKEASTYRLDWEPQNANGAWIPRNVITVKDQDAIYSAMREEGFDPFTTAFVYERDVPSPPALLPLGEGSASVEGKSTGYMKIAANAPAPALLVLSEAFHWNWTALVNGSEVKPLVVNGALLGVPILAGNNTIELSYRPLDLWVGAAISAVTLVVMIALLLVASRRTAKT